MKKFRLLIILGILFFAVSCSGNNNSDTDNNTVEKEKVIRVLVPGNERTKGFLASGFRGFSRIKSEIENVNIGYLSDIDDSEDALIEGLKELAKDKPDLIIAVGGQNDGPVSTVSKEFPDTQFAVIQGSVHDDNLSSYNVKQEESAYLAGALAGLMTKTDIVGHISGTTQKSGQYARSAFFQGVRHTNPDAQLLSDFTGDMDDVGINKIATQKQIDSGADYIFVMLNEGREGADEAIKNSGKNVREIGNVIDWTQENQQYIASAVADPSVAVFEAASDIVNDKFRKNTIHEIGIEDSEVVGLAIGKDVPEDVKEQIEKLKEQILSGEIKIIKELD